MEKEYKNRQCCACHDKKQSTNETWEMRRLWNDKNTVCEQRAVVAS